MTYLTRDTLNLDELMRSVSSPECGGTCVFLGSVRSGPEDGAIQAIDYSAYEPMVEAEFDRILAEARRQWPAARIAVRHRVGTIPVGEASIAIAAATPHRAEAFAACRFVIEQVKQRMPVWKQERRADGSAAWVT